MVVHGDGADLGQLALMAPRVQGITTNPALMKRAGVSSYRSFAKAVLGVANGKPVSFEVLAADMEGMVREARVISSWGENVFVKIPVLTPGGSFTGPVLSKLTKEGIKVNVTAVMTEDQVDLTLMSLHSRGNIISIFAGRIADSGVDPEPLVRAAAHLGEGHVQILWASVREVFNVKQAERSGADIITVTPDILAKMEGFGRDLEEYSAETSRQFARDAEGIRL